MATGPEAVRSDRCSRRAQLRADLHEVAGLWRSPAGRRCPGLARPDGSAAQACWRRPSSAVQSRCRHVRTARAIARTFCWSETCGAGRHGKAMRIDVPGSLTLDEPDMMAQASRAGLGLAYVGEWLVADDVASGRLVEVLSEWTPSYPGYCLYYPGRRHMAASLRAFVDLAKEMVFRNRAAS